MNFPNSLALQTGRAYLARVIRNESTRRGVAAAAAGILMSMVLEAAWPSQKPADRQLVGRRPLGGRRAPSKKAVPSGAGGMDLAAGRGGCAAGARTRCPRRRRLHGPCPGGAEP